MKTNKSTFGTLHQMNSYNSVTNEHFTFVNRPMFLDGHIDLGVNVGVQIKEKHFIELGISSDHSSIGRSLLTHSTVIDNETGESYMRDAYSHNTTSIYYWRISADYHNNFWKNKKETIAFRSMAGIGVLLNPSGNRNYSANGSASGPGLLSSDDFGFGIINENYGNDEMHQIEPDVFITDYVSEIEIYRGVSPYVKFGLGVDFSTKKDFHLFSFDVSYILNSIVVQQQESKITVMDHGTETNYRYNQSSRSSGLYFTLSRKFQVHPWIPLKRKKDQI
ncbi:hypothetical protein DXU93_02870 [Brumimicrobium aurantiacum]|uniref:Uncharacterized protein n=2 Tax=Brumimicrobium aurantiacum TaxID=1737063 RepID=A0A3E1F252_9FLAO|nr:hypothetical protein DXU93_02870 [Brumimicrobium aurantiacum]